MANGAILSQNNFVPVSGGEMTGPLILSENPTQDMQAATKEYVDQTEAAISSFEIGDLLFSTKDQDDSWQLCNGQENNNSQYPQLAQYLPSSFGNTNSIVDVSIPNISSDGCIDVYYLPSLGYYVYGQSYATDPTQSWTLSNFGSSISSGNDAEAINEVVDDTGAIHYFFNRYTYTGGGQANYARLMESSTYNVPYTQYTQRAYFNESLNDYRWSKVNFYETSAGPLYITILRRNSSDRPTYAYRQSNSGNFTVLTLSGISASAQVSDIFYNENENMVFFSGCTSSGGYPYLCYAELGNTQATNIDLTNYFQDVWYSFFESGLR